MTRTPKVHRTLFITPIAPVLSGNGLAMRAALIAQGLANAGELIAVVIPAAGNPNPGDLKWIKGLAIQTIVVPALNSAEAAQRWVAQPEGRALLTAVGDLPQRARLVSPACGDIVSTSLDIASIDALYVFRLYTVGAALPLFSRAAQAKLILDIDEDEAALLNHRASIENEQGNEKAAAELTAEANAYRQLLDASISLFGTIVTSSELESQQLQSRYTESRVETIVNALDFPMTPTPEKETGAPTILLVGNLNYPPNRDAAIRLITGIFPGVLAHSPAAQLHIVGAGELPLKGSHPGVTLHGPLESLDPIYTLADTVVVPLNTGGGSRLKLLEAFGRQIPVVCTAKAAEGLNVESGNQLLIAESDDEIVNAVLRLLEEP
ncbi:MAG: glycosyltransferase family 4 protein, partial [Pseudomonadota bacterium]